MVVLAYLSIIAACLFPLLLRSLLISVRDNHTDPLALFYFCACCGLIVAGIVLY